jgi:exosortase
MESKQNNPDSQPTFVQELTECWQRLPNKGFFLILLAAWIILFQFLGNGTFGYVHSASLFGWMDTAYGGFLKGGEDEQGYFVPVVVLGLFWMKRKELLALPLRAWWPGLLLLMLALAIHLLGYAVQQQRISIIAMFLGIYALMGLAWGSQWLRASFFPFVLLAFCIPIASISEPVSFPLRHLVAKMVTVICNDGLGMSVLREGTQLFNPSHTYAYDVAAACSGLRSMMAILALATVYAFMNFDKAWKRILMMLLAFPFAVIGNVCRMLGIIITADLSGQAAGNFVHENWFFSLVPYLPAMFGIFLVGRWLREDLEPSTPGLTAKPA